MHDLLSSRSVVVCFQLFNYHDYQLKIKDRIYLSNRLNQLPEVNLVHCVCFDKCYLLCIYFLLQVVTLLLAFLISLTLMWDPTNEIYFIRASYGIWYALSAHISCYFNFIRLPAFLICQLILLIGFTVPYKVDPAVKPTGMYFSHFYFCFFHTVRLFFNL